MPVIITNSLQKIPQANLFLPGIIMPDRRSCRGQFPTCRACALLRSGLWQEQLQLCTARLPLPEGFWSVCEPSFLGGDKQGQELMAKKPEVVKGSNGGAKGLVTQVTVPGNCPCPAPHPHPSTRVPGEVLAQGPRAPMNSCREWC